MNRDRYWTTPEYLAVVRRRAVRRVAKHVVAAALVCVVAFALRQLALSYIAQL